MKIILVDDDRDSLKSLHKFLLFAGYEVDAFNSPIEVVDSLKGSDLVDYIISDYNMPSLTGVELIKKVKLQHPSITSIIYTGYENRKIVEEIESNKINFFFRKPIDLEQLTKILEGESKSENL